MLEEILKKESIDENDIKVLVANLHLLSNEDKARFGFPIHEEASVEETPVEVVKTTARRRKVV